MSSKMVYQSTRPARWPAPEGTEVVVTARYGGDAVSITWQRNDLEEKGIAPLVVTATVDDLRAIISAIEAEA